MLVRRLIPIAFLALAAPACQKSKPAATPPLPVTFAAATTGDVPLYLDTFGNCVAIASVTIVPQVTGILSQTQFAEGTAVKKGGVIFQIDPQPYEAALTQAQGNLESAKANLLNAQQDLARQQKLYQTKVADVQEFQNAQAAAQAAQGSVLAGEAALKTAQINLGYCTISSPIDGRTGPYLINTGNLVTANQSKLVNIQTQSPIYVDYTVSESDLPQLRQWLDGDGLEVDITIPGDADYIGRGTLRFIDNQVASGTGTLEMRATLPNADLRLLPGQFVNVRLILTTLKGAILVPATAVLVGQTGDYVFVLQADNTVAIRPVKKGQREGDNVLIESGLAAGEKVITSGQIGLAQGVKVAPQPHAAPAAK
ncbi:MAG: efflux RND transporter periplasmic adaptor subunit [Terrimicrobiaceae bacterium]|nr:efflux RND transporter periplasmic adaptor subunit [Terrimicrobiaceae bacterium]